MTEFIRYLLDLHARYHDETTERFLVQWLESECRLRWPDMTK